ncbi:Protein N-acetyltransferase, RimJ/RimL family [Haloarcula vallismortis]|uniref:Acetyltransferase n=2 Tax=Haloarcula vallismortis TaxID=28442 RepID=M0J0J9_HALVA|nr:GNAT family protein [Haloarcula vallismortis]EMA01878.1 acetyltransferase [Haloarcula vallismortis ATCC 29715]SDW52170.1 Protein N-acetyltransferase, RimJ/RimL family [Haloarcula vallismortis]
MPGPSFLATDRTALRSPERDDLDWIQRVFHDEKVWGLGTYARPPTSDQMETFYEETLSDEDSVHLLICADPAGSPGAVEDRTEPVGLVAMTDHDPERGTAELAYWLDPDAWGQGYATEAAGRLVQYGFDQRALRKWSAKIVGGNDRSVAVVERLGFTEEGTHREEWYLDGEWRDMLWFGLLQTESN